MCYLLFAQAGSLSESKSALAKVMAVTITFDHHSEPETGNHKREFSAEISGDQSQIFSLCPLKRTGDFLLSGKGAD